MPKPIARVDQFIAEANDLRLKLSEIGGHYRVLHDLRYGERRTGDSAGRGDAASTPTERIFCTCPLATHDHPIPPPCPRCKADAAIREMSDWMPAARARATKILHGNDKALKSFDPSEAGVTGELPRTALKDEVASSTETAALRKAEERFEQAGRDLAAAAATLEAATERRQKAEAKRRKDAREAERRRNLHAMGRVCGVKNCACRKKSKKTSSNEWAGAPAN